MNIITIGKRHEPWLRDGIERYQRRLIGPWQLTWILLPASHQQTEQASRQSESQHILRKIKSSDYVILLDERGKLYDSPALAQQLHHVLQRTHDITFVIGGAYGVSPELLQRADTVWSLSSLVFPHQIVRLLVVEQLYRCQQIIAGHPYHHE